MRNHDELRCNRCGKLCAKASSLKRHNYYCRSKPSIQPKSRKRCCEACTRSKIRCDATFPTCSSCASRSIVCQYVDHALPNLDYELVSPGGSSIPQASVSSSLTVTNTVNPYALNDDAGLPPNLDLNAFDTHLSQNIFDLTPVPPAFDASLLFVDAEMGSDSIIEAGQAYSNTISPTSLHWRPPRVMIQRSVDTPNGRMAVAMMKQIFESFPHMMTSKETFPPFIHPRCYDYFSGSIETSDIIRDCTGLAHMFQTKTAASERVFWRAIRMEQEKLYFQHESYSEHELQAACQALVIYTVMRLVDQKPGYEDLEVPLLHSLKFISNHLCHRLGMSMYRLEPDEHEDRHWQNWIFCESQRRLITMARIMNLAFTLDSAFSSKPLDGFSLVPLPAHKVGWETNDETVWGEEYDKCQLARKLHALTSDGKLMVIRQTGNGIDMRAEGWSQWMAQQDGFGVLVLLSSQILKKAA